MWRSCSDESEVNVLIQGGAEVIHAFWRIIIIYTTIKGTNWHKFRLLVKKPIIDFKIPPCSESYIPSFGWFPGFWIVYADVSKHAVCSIFIGRFFLSTWPMKMERTVTKRLLSYLLNYSLTHSMQQSPSWEANRFVASQEIPRILWIQKFHYRLHKCPPPVSIVRQLNPVHTPTPCFLKIHLNIILPSTPRSPQGSLLLRVFREAGVYN
jgi:hypothetical protein